MKGLTGQQENNMETVIIVIHLMVVVALVVVVLLQRSEGGALGIGGGSGGGFMSARGAANALTRTTAVLAAAFFATSITLGILSGYDGGSSILDEIPLQQNNTPGEGDGILDQIGGPVGREIPGEDTNEEVPTGQ